MMDYEKQCIDLLESSKYLISNISPSQWNEEHRIMTTGVSPFPGRFSYALTPYLKEIVDCLMPGHPAHTVAVEKGAQVGFSTGVIEAGIGWIISENPGNILFLTGHADLSEEAMSGKIDQMIDSCGLRPLIRPNVLRTRNQRTGDTNKSKEFPGGSLTAGGAGNHKLLRQRSVQYCFVDDFDAAKKSSAESGSTKTMIEHRLAAYASKRKLFYISTPEVKQTSNIEPVYLLGDQRRFFIPCPCCAEYISLHWSIPLENNEKEMGGITWQLDEKNKIIKGSVGYICQKCGDFFDDKKKAELLSHGEWRPTAEPSKVGYYSYHLSALYAPPGMDDWEHYAGQYLEANPVGGKIKPDLMQAFTNLVLGETYEVEGEAPKANDLQKNIRDYQIGLIPEKVSEKDGNGKIMLLTCAVDLNGVELDARVDYEIVGWAETGASYSITHGSIGTFVPRENSKKNKEDRAKWTYEHNKPNSVWKVLDGILNAVYETDTGRRMKIMMSGIDTGHYTDLAYAYVDKRNSPFCCGLKGDKENKYRKYGIDTAKFKRGKGHPNMYMVDVNLVKDELAQTMKLRWDAGNDDSQPPNFMNFPQPSDGKYLFQNYFSHYEAEHRVISSKAGEDIAARWDKKTSIAQNHFWDVRVYNIVLKEILVNLICKDMKIKNPSWSDYVDILLNRKQ